MSASLLRGHSRSPRQKTALHLAPDPYRVAVGDVHIGPTHRIARRDVADQLYAVREADRQRVLGEAAFGRDEFAPDRIPAFSVEHLAGAQRTLCDSRDIAAPAIGLASRLAAQRR